MRLNSYAQPAVTFHVPNIHLQNATPPCPQTTFTHVTDMTTKMVRIALAEAMCWVAVPHLYVILQALPTFAQQLCLHIALQGRTEVCCFMPEQLQDSDTLLCFFIMPANLTKVRPLCRLL